MHNLQLLVVDRGPYLNVGCSCGWRDDFPFTGRDDETALRQQTFDNHLESSNGP